MNVYREIRQAISEEDALVRIAEKCTTLAQYALGWQQMITGQTTKYLDDEMLIDRLMRGVADVYLAVDVWAYGHDAAEISACISEKVDARAKLWSKHVKRRIEGNAEVNPNCVDACPIIGNVARRPAEEEPPRMT